MTSKYELIFWTALLIAISIQAANAQPSHAGCPTPPFDSKSYAEADSSPLRFHSKEILIVVHHGPGGTPIFVGDNFLDSTRSVVCRTASGCLLTITTMVTGGEGYICALVDGYRAHPFPPFMNASNPVTTLQSQLVAAGTHTIQTDLKANNTGTLGPWEVYYTLYEGR